MFPETLVTLICTLEKSWSCADAGRPRNIVTAAMAKIITSRVILFIFPPPSSAAHCSTTRWKCELEKVRLSPGRERAAAKQGFGGPLAEIDGERDAMTVVSGEDDHVFALRMAAKNRAHSFGEQNRPGPAVRDARGLQRRMQMMHAALEPAETLLGFSFAHIEAVQIWRSEFLCVLTGLAKK